MARARSSRAAREPSGVGRAVIRSAPNKIPLVIASTPEVTTAWTRSGIMLLMRS